MRRLQHCDRGTFAFCLTAVVFATLSYAGLHVSAQPRPDKDLAAKRALWTPVGLTGGDAVASELMRSFYDSDLADAVSLLQPLEDGLSAMELRGLEPKYLAAVLKVAMTFETMGLLVYRRVAPFDLALDLAGGLVQLLWRKLGRYVKEVREEQGHPAFAEWYEWFAMVCEIHHKEDVEPAYERGADWKP